METLVLGTAASVGAPAGCPCAPCAGQRRAGRSRRPTSAVLDASLVLDPDRGTEASAARAGRALTAVRTVALSRVPTDAAAVRDLVRSCGGGGPVRVLGPASALSTLTALDLPREVSTEVLSPGTRAECAGFVLHALGGDPEVPGALGYDVTAASGDRLLYAPSGELPPEGADVGPYDVVLLGAAEAAVVPHLVAALRRQGTVTPRTDVVLVGLDPHRLIDGTGPGQLGHTVAAWGARVVPDATVLAAVAGPAPFLGRTLVLGGVRSGKSTWAETLLSAEPVVTYVATGGLRPDDAEWRARVETHRLRRPPWWRTRETIEVTTTMRETTDPLLLDCLGTWLTARLDLHAAWEDPEGLRRVEDDVDALVQAWRDAGPRPLVAVSNEVGSGVVPFHASGRLFRDLLGRLNARMAAESETVLLVVAGVAVPLRDLSLHVT